MGGWMNGWRGFGLVVRAVDGHAAIQVRPSAGTASNTFEWITPAP
jgi:hypothetical protein